jgi:hypothetical protein
MFLKKRSAARDTRSGVMNWFTSPPRNVPNGLSRLLSAVALGALLSASGPTCGVFAQSTGCSDQCRAAFGACYKATANRAACETQLQRCLDGCHAAKRG